jgi:hypothetical protein
MVCFSNTILAGFPLFLYPHDFCNRLNSYDKKQPVTGAVPLPNRVPPPPQKTLPGIRINQRFLSAIPGR